MSLKVAVGKNRFQKVWANTEIAWEQLLMKLSNTHRTHETYAEYVKMSAAKQGEIKDVGGFIGGHLEGGKRSVSTVLYRSLITLDADFADVNFWDNLTTFEDYACCIYSTHKHTNLKPRIRLVIPLKRDVSPEEYEAISRRVADGIGMDLFDDTTYQASRLMYWPSTAKDGDFLFKVQDGEWLDPDKVLATYSNWKDMSFWPMSSRVQEIHKRESKKQTDPREKQGLIGAFCRAHTISEAIEKFLSDVYMPSRTKGRYDYTKGSTAAGLVTYEDTWAYSNHGTDPAGGKLCNAFDLVRIHKFKDLDEEAKEGTPHTQLPSFKAMFEMIAEDPETKIEHINTLMPEDLTTSTKEETDWRLKLTTEKNGSISNTRMNALTILRNDEQLKNSIAFNELLQDPETTKNLPWKKVSRTNSLWRDADDSQTLMYIEKKYKVALSEANFKHAINVVADDNHYHPIREYLDSCKWDGEPRIDTLLIDLFSAEDNDYVRAVTRKTLTAAVARIYEPGIKFDYMLTLVGRGGIGKSTLFDRLGGDWFSDSSISLSGKESFDQIQGVWILEMSEMASFKKAEVEQIKSYLSKREDKYRMAYARRNTLCPRQCIIVGTTNNKSFLRDKTGNRRFWIVDVADSGVKPWEILDKEFVKQCWAEAKHYYKQKEPLCLDERLEAIARETQEEHMEIDTKEQAVINYLNRHLPANWEELGRWERREFIQSDEIQSEEYTVERTTVCAAEVAFELFKKEPSTLDRFESMEINIILENLKGWSRFEKVKRFGPYGVQRGFKKIT